MGAGGIDVLTVSQAGLLGAPDVDYLVRSRNTGRVVVTHDSDFLLLHQRQEPAGIAHRGPGTQSMGLLVAGLALICKVLEPRETVG